MLEPGRKYSTASAYRFGYNGKEQDSLLGGGVGIDYNYGARILDARIGRFFSVDPLISKFPYYSSYQYAGDEPVAKIDLDGLEDVEPAPTSTEPELSNSYVDPNGRLYLAPVAPAPPGGDAIPMPGGTEIITPDGDASYIPTPSVFGPQPPPPSIDFRSQEERQMDKEIDQANQEYTYILRNINNDKVTPVVATTFSLNTIKSPSNTPANNNTETPKIFYITYTKSVTNTDGSVSVYSGRTQGTYTGNEPTRSDADAAVEHRDMNHHIKDYGAARVDKYSTNYLAIRGREQQLIDRHGGARSEGGRSGNPNRGVSRINPLRYLYDMMATSKWGKLPNNNPADKKTTP